MKKIISLFICALLCFSVVIPTFAADTTGTCGNLATWNYDGVTKTLTISGSGPITDYADVVSIPWKSYCKEIKNINISDGITSIGDYSLSYCENVEEISIPDSVTKIGKDAFGWCSSLKNIKFSNSLKEIDDEAFTWCKSLETVNLPASVNDIESSSFIWCYNLKAINVDDKNQKYGSYDGVLYDTVDAELVTYPSGKTETEFTLPSNIIQIAESSFNGNKNLVNVDLASVAQIGEKAFFSCQSLYSVKMDAVEKIDDRAFYRCSNLVKVSFPENLREIKNEAFRNCTNLQLAEFYGDGTSIDNDAFDGDEILAIVGNEGSTCHYFAVQNNLPFNIFVKVNYNGNYVNFDPVAFIVNDATTLVPMRQVFEMLEADVTWDELTNTARATKNGITVNITIGSDTMYKNGEAIALPANGQLIADKTYVPLRAISEAFGTIVEWDGGNNTVFMAAQ